MPKKKQPLPLKDLLPRFPTHTAAEITYVTREHCKGERLPAKPRGRGRWRGLGYRENEVKRKLAKRAGAIAADLFHYPDARGIWIARQLVDSSHPLHIEPVPASVPDELRGYSIGNNSLVRAIDEDRLTAEIKTVKGRAKHRQFILFKAANVPEGEPPKDLVTLLAGTGPRTLEELRQADPEDYANIAECRILGVKKWVLLEYSDSDAPQRKRGARFRSRGLRRKRSPRPRPHPKLTRLIKTSRRWRRYNDRYFEETTYRIGDIRKIAVADIAIPRPDRMKTLAEAMKETDLGSTTIVNAINAGLVRGEKRVGTTTDGESNPMWFVDVNSLRASRCYWIGGCDFYPLGAAAMYSGFTVPKLGRWTPKQYGGLGENSPTGQTLNCRPHRPIVGEKQGPEIIVYPGSELRKAEQEVKGWAEPRPAPARPSHRPIGTRSRQKSSLAAIHEPVLSSYDGRGRRIRGQWAEDYEVDGRRVGSAEALSLLRAAEKWRERERKRLKNARAHDSHVPATI
jgi:hypothetical protein